jgi:hypothetical protein
MFASMHRPRALAGLSAVRASTIRRYIAARRSAGALRAWARRHIARLTVRMAELAGGAEVVIHAIGAAGTRRQTVSSGRRGWRLCRGRGAIR